MPYKDPEKQRTYGLAYHKKWYAKNSEKVKKCPSYGTLYARATPEAALAHNRVAAAIKKGILVRPSQCEACQKMCKPEAAHLDYQKPLDVRWLCRNCHRTMDAANPNHGLMPLAEHRKMVAENAARRAAAYEWKPCVICGTLYHPVPSRPGQKYCSVPCYNVGRARKF